MTRKVLLKLRLCGKLLAAGSALIMPPVVIGQTSDAQKPPVAQEIQFEVATVRPNVSGCCTSSRGTTDQMVLTNETLKNLVVLAYTVQPDQVTGPDWINKTRFDITGKFPPGTNYRDRWRMLQALLKDRFRLTTHTEPKEISGYSLQVAKSGFKLKPSEPGQAGYQRGDR